MEKMKPYTVKKANNFFQFFSIKRSQNIEFFLFRLSNIFEYSSTFATDPDQS
jgi:hypothetical protein